MEVDGDGLVLDDGAIVAVAGLPESLVELAALVAAVQDRGAVRAPGRQHTVVPVLVGDGDLPQRLWDYDDFMSEEDPPVSDFSAGLVSLGFIKAALRRSARLWCRPEDFPFS